jgi:hypothetical protein
MSEKMKKILFLLMLIGVVLASGCLGTQVEKKPAPGTNGLIISDFYPDANVVQAGYTVYLNLEVQNVGGAKATNIDVSLYGVTFGKGDFDWDLTQGKQSFKYADEMNLTELRPPEEGIPGEVAPMYTWTLIAPRGIKADTPYSFDVRVGYDYTTDVTGVLTFVSKTYWESLSKSEKEALAKKAGVSQLTQTGGPISVTLYAGTRQMPFVVYSGQNTYILRVTITNVGSGEPKDTIRLVSQKASTGMSISCAVPPDGIRLSRGKTASFSCTLTLTDTNILNKQDFTVGLGFEYGWRVDSSTEITVQKPLT